MKPVRYPESGHVHPYPTGEDVADPASLPWRIWVPENPILVLGYSQEADREINLDAAKAAGIPVYKRRSGGGAVFLCEGVVCVALRFHRREHLGISDYFALGNGLIQSAIRDAFGVDLELRGISDLAWKERKVLGSTLHLPRDRAVYLASLLVDIPLDSVDRFLLHPSRAPDYRRGRKHADFIQNLAAIPGLESITAEGIRDLLIAKVSGFQSPELAWPHPAD